MGDILLATFEKRQTEGAPAELQKHYKLGAHQIPLEMLRIDSERRGTRCGHGPGEHRRRQSQAQVVTPVFASGDGAFLGIERPSVPVGDGSLPSPVHPSIREGAIQRTRVKRPKPTLNLWQPIFRLRGCKRSFSATGAQMQVRFSGLDAALRLGAETVGCKRSLDQQAIERHGWFVDFHESRQQQRVGGFDIRAVPFPACCTVGVDGRYARTPGDIRMIVGTGHLLAHASAAFKGNNSDESGVERLQEKSGGLMVSAHSSSTSPVTNRMLSSALAMERGACCSTDVAGRQPGGR